MSKIDFLKEQIIEARTFVNRLMSELPEDLWYVIPEGTDSNFIWQVPDGYAGRRKPRAGGSRPASANP